MGQLDNEQFGMCKRNGGPRLHPDSRRSTESQTQWESLFHTHLKTLALSTVAVKLDVMTSSNELGKLTSDWPGLDLCSDPDWCGFGQGKNNHFTSQLLFQVSWSWESSSTRWSGLSAGRWVCFLLLPSSHLPGCFSALVLLLSPEFQRSVAWQRVKSPVPLPAPALCAGRDLQHNLECGLRRKKPPTLPIRPQLNHTISTPASPPPQSHPQLKRTLFLHLCAFSGDLFAGCHSDWSLNWGLLLLFSIAFFCTQLCVV